MESLAYSHLDGEVIMVSILGYENKHDSTMVNVGQCKTCMDLLVLVLVLSHPPRATMNSTQWGETKLAGCQGNVSPYDDPSELKEPPFRGKPLFQFHTTLKEY